MLVAVVVETSPHLRVIVARVVLVAEALEDVQQLMVRQDLLT